MTYINVGCPNPCCADPDAVEARVRTQVAAELDSLRAQLLHFRDEWTIEGDSTWLWLDRILAGEQGCVMHAIPPSGPTGTPEEPQP